MIDNLKIIQKKIKSKILFDFQMNNSTWFRAGGKAKAFVIASDIEELNIILNATIGIPYCVLGAGSNILIRDKGYDGIIIKLGSGFNKITIENDSLKVGASILDLTLSNFARKNGILGYEFYSGIPGTIGGAVKMNAGSFGSETADFLKKISVINYKREIENIGIENLNMNYRSSNINDSTIVTSAEFSLKYGDLNEIEDRFSNIKSERLKKQPIKEKTSGCTFKNPPNNIAAKLIQDSGCKGMFVGDAFVSNQHSNFLINKGSATASNIEDLGKKIIERVYKKFGIVLEWEIKIIGV